MPPKKHIHTWDLSNLLVDRAIEYSELADKISNTGNEPTKHEKHLIRYAFLPIIQEQMETTSLLFLKGDINSAVSEMEHTIAIIGDCI